MVRLISYLAPAFPRSLFELIGELVDAEVIFDESRSGPVTGDDPFADGTADLGWVCATSYAGLLASTSRPSVQLVGVAWVPDDPGSSGRAHYYGDVVVRAESPVRSFADLSSATVGCNDEVSLSGFYSLQFEQQRRGMEPDSLADLVFTGGHQRSLDLLVAGELEAAVVDSVVRLARGRSDAAVAGLRVVQRLGPWPTQPLVMRSDASSSEVADVRERLLEAAGRPPLATELAAAGLSELVEVNAEHYQSVHEAFTSYQRWRTQ